MTDDEYAAAAKAMTNDQLADRWLEVGMRGGRRRQTNEVKAIVAEIKCRASVHGQRYWRADYWKEKAIEAQDEVQRLHRNVNRLSEACDDLEKDLIQRQGMLSEVPNHG